MISGKARALQKMFVSIADSRPFLVPACLAVLATTYAIETFSPIGRPIWFDEFVQFAYAAAPNTHIAWKVIQSSGEGISHGQTGFLTLLQYWSLDLFGASAWALRWPAAVATACMFFSLCLIFARYRHALLWQTATTCALLLQWNLMHHTGEGRPYILLCAAVALTLTYYLAPLDARARPLYWALGYGGVVTGALFHPYFAIYWAGIVVLTWIDRTITDGRRPTLASFARAANIALVLIGTGCYFLVGELSWMRFNVQHNFDPFQWLPKDAIAQVVLTTHLDFIRVTPALYTYAALVSLLTIVALRRLGAKAVCKSVAGPLLLILLAFTLTLLVSYISWRTHYWIVQRQWVASIMIVPVASILLVARLGEAVANAPSPVANARGFIAVTVPALVLAVGVGCLATKTVTLDVQFVPAAAEDVASADWKTRVDFTEAYAATTAANRNIQVGGPVAPEFLRYYCQFDYVRRATIGLACDTPPLLKQ